MEKQPSQSILSLAEPVGLLFFNAILIWVSTFQKLSLRLLSLLLGSHIELPTLPPKEQGPKNAASEVSNNLHLSREDVETVIGCMGMSYSLEGGKLKELMEFDELSTMFEEEPSLEEVKAAFHVFDQNCDGFIDPMELQILLSNLGFAQGLALDTCVRMIATYDHDRDGRIDFNEFMDCIFC